jgi:hypothetical protein
LRRRIHQPSLLPHNIHRNGYAMSRGKFLAPREPFFTGLYLFHLQAGRAGGSVKIVSQCKSYTANCEKISQTIKHSRRAERVPDSFGQCARILLDQLLPLAFDHNAR